MICKLVIQPEEMLQQHADTVFTFRLQAVGGKGYGEVVRQCVGFSVF
jgi:hypothetical protein